LIGVGAAATTRYGHGVVISGGYMYVIYGILLDNTYLNTIYKLDLTTGTWSGPLSTSGVAPSARRYFGCFVYNGFIYLIGGQDGTNYLNEVHRLDLATLTWSGTLSCSGTPPTARFMNTGRLSGSNFYIFEGSNATTYKNDLHYLSLDTLTWSGEVATTGTPPSARSNSVIEIHGGFLYVFSGTTGTRQNDLHRINLSTLAWSGELSVSGNKPPIIYAAQSSLVSGWMYIYGGYTTTYSASTYRINLNTLTWSDEISLSKKPTGRYGHSLVFYDNYVYLHSGYGSGASDVWRLPVLSGMSYRCTYEGTSNASTEPTWGVVEGVEQTEASSGVKWTAYLDNTVASNRGGLDYYIYSCVPTSGTVPKLLL
jgi:hypothetical protein